MSLRNKIALWSLVGVIVAVSICFQWIRPAYRTIKMWHYIHLAESLVDKKDYGDATQAYRKALLSSPEKPEAWEAVAKFLEKTDDPGVIGIWARLAAMKPEVRKYRYKQIAAAIKYGRSYDAEQVMNSLPESWRGDADYLHGLAEIATQKNQISVAENALGEILKSNPGDQYAQYQMMVVRAKSANLEIKLDARKKLLDVGNGNSKFAAPALRYLIDLAAEEQDPIEADRLATKLVSLSEATTKDRLTHVQYELITQSFTINLSVKNLRKYAQEHPDAFETVVKWLMANKVDEDGMAVWIKALPPKLCEQPQVKSGLLQYYLSIGDFDQVFKELRQLSGSMKIPARVLDTAENALGHIDDDYATADRLWMQAIYASERNTKALFMLSLVASARGWSSATGRALAALADANPGNTQVWTLLAEHESAAGNLPGYYKALSGIMEINPYDVHVASDWVIASVLLKKEDKSEILDVAKRTYDATEPADPWAGTAYAMALLHDNRPQEALEIIMRMTERNRLLPQRAIYVGAILAAAGRKEEALQFFDRADGFKAANFPEERFLLRMWEGVAKGEATTAQEQEQLLASKGDLQKEAARIEETLRTQLKKRSNPEEVQRILESLKSERQSRDEASPEVQKLIQQIRSDGVKSEKPAAK